MDTLKRSLGITSPTRLLVGAGINLAGFALLATEALHLSA
jgi:hypothetical protein